MNMIKLLIRMAALNSPAILLVSLFASSPSLASGFSDTLRGQVSQFSRGRSEQPRRYISPRPPRRKSVVTIRVSDRNWDRPYRYYPRTYIRSDWSSPVYRPVYKPVYRPRTRVNHQLTVLPTPIVVAANTPDGACVEFAHSRYRDVYSSDTAMEEAIRGCKDLAVYGSSDQEEALSCLQYSYDIRSEVHGAATSMDKAFEDCKS